MVFGDFEIDLLTEVRLLITLFLLFQRLPSDVQLREESKSSGHGNVGGEGRQLAAFLVGFGREIERIDGEVRG